jgi:NAD dependent epimerase/dehydratase family enzyme
VGERAARGDQFISWIHDAEFVRAIEFLIGNEQLSGPVNLCSPCPLPNREFMRALRQSSGMPVGLPAAKWMLEAGAF